MSDETFQPRRDQLYVRKDVLRWLKWLRPDDCQTADEWAERILTDALTAKCPDWQAREQELQAKLAQAYKDAKP